MLRNYLLIALRTLRRRRGFAFINIAGLALGVATCLLIGLYVQDELRFDRFHENGERIYRVSQRVMQPEGEELWAWTGGAMGEYLEQDFAWLEAIVRFHPDPGVVRYEDEGGVLQSYREEGFMFADAAVWDAFTFPFLQGDPASAFATPNSVVLTASTARKYFGEANPIGRTLSYDGSLDLTVTGVLEDIPRHSHLRFDFLAPMAAFKQSQGMPADARFGSFWWPSTYTYVLVPDAAAAGELAAELPAFIARHREMDETEQYLPTLEALYDLHLRSEAANAPGAGGSITLVRLFLAISIAVLLLACINFVNLATAKATKRAKEVGVRKSVGAQRGQLVRQFLGESVMTSLVALVLALGLVELILPFFNELAGRELTVGYAANGPYWLGLAGLLVLTGLGAGLYPALHLSRFRPAQVLKGTYRRTRGGIGLRRTLIVFQFTVSIVLITGTAIAVAQLSYMQNARLGFDDEQMVTLRLSGDVSWSQLENALLADASVRGVTSASMRPGLGVTSSLPYNVGPMGEQENAGDIGLQYVDYDYFDLLDLELIAGRGFDADRRADQGVVPEGVRFYHIYDRALVINEATARANGWTMEEALGQELRVYALEGGTYYTDLRGTIVGIVQDYHQSSFRSTIRPMLFMTAESPGGFAGGWALVKLAPGNARDALDRLQGIWQQVAPDQPFEASFLDQDLQNLYVEEARLGKIIGAFAGIGILIACLGLFGLAAYAAEQRTKEIGVRKVMGASVPSILALLSRDFVVLVAVAAAVATPVAYLTMNAWLDDFAYRIELSAWFFIAAAALALVVALATVSTQAFKAARVNPTDALRYE